MKQIERQIDLLRIMVRNPAYRETLRKALDKTADTMEHLLAVAKAAETYERLDNTNARLSMRKALAKLQDQDDE
jgi:arsenate reductase-like glutaredoxin family protein